MPLSPRPPLILVDGVAVSPVPRSNLKLVSGANALLEVSGDRITVAGGVSGGVVPADQVTYTSTLTAGQVLSGTVTWTILPSNPVTSIEFWIDGVLKSTDTSGPYTYTFDSTTLADGNHAFGIAINTADGSRSARQIGTATVRNAASTAYFSDGFSTGYAAYLPWIGFQTDDPTTNSPGWYDIRNNGGRVTQTPNGRSSIVLDPAGSGLKVIRHEIRNSDPPWPPGGTDQKKEEVSTGAHFPATWSDTGTGFSFGLTRWFGFSYYLPSPGFDLNGTYTVLWDIHPTVTSINCLIYQQTGSRNNAWFTVELRGGDTTPAWFGADYEHPNIHQLSDASGNLLASELNKWHRVVIGCKFAHDGTIGARGSGSSTGWCEIYFDRGGTGLNRVYAKDRPVMYNGETGPYITGGLYTGTASPFPSGGCVIYKKNIKAGLTLADVA